MPYETEPSCADCKRTFAETSKPQARHVIGAYFARNRRVICDDCLRSPFRHKRGTYMAALASDIKEAVEMSRAFEPIAEKDLAAAIAKGLAEGYVVVVRNDNAQPF